VGRQAKESRRGEKITLTLGFTDDEKINGDPNRIYPLIISVIFQKHQVGGYLIDEGNLVDILYENTFEPVGLKREKMKYCFGLEAIGLNGTNARPWGYVTLDVTLGEGAGRRTIEIPFLVILDASTYNCVFGRPTLAALDLVASTVHLKMNYHSIEGEVVTVHTDLNGVRKLYEIP